MREMLSDAIYREYAVGYFESWDQYSFEAVLEAAEELRSPVVLGFGGSMMNQTWFDRHGLRALAAFGMDMCTNAKVPVSFILNEAQTYKQIIAGLTLGFNVVMLDTSGLEFAENIERTSRVTEAAHSIGIDVEGECDELPDASGSMHADTHTTLTDPNRALRYVEETGIDALSVSIGNVHILTEGSASIDFDLLAKLHEVVPVPLVIHGGTGFPDKSVKQAIKLGVAKFNVGTILKKIFLESIRGSLAVLPEKPEIQKVIGSRKPDDIFEVAKEKVKEEVKRRIFLYGSNGKAD